MNKRNYRLTDLRRSYGLTQSDLGNEVGLTQSMIAQIEKGTRDPSSTYKLRLANYFNVSVEWLFFEQLYVQSITLEVVHIMSHRTINDYPLILKADHISEIIGCSKRVAYELMDQAEFPLLRMGRLKRVERDAFFTWLKVQGNKSTVTNEKTINLWEKRYQSI